VDVVGVLGGSLLVLMIEAPHSLHTHIRSSLYIYKVFQHLELWLVVIKGCHHTLIFAVCDLRVDLLGVGGGSLLVLMIEAPHPFILISDLLYTYIKCFSTLNCG
jgi:hypothetical protein